MNDKRNIIPHPENFIFLFPELIQPTDLDQQTSTKTLLPTGVYQITVVLGRQRCAWKIFTTFFFRSFLFYFNFHIHLHCKFFFQNLIKYFNHVFHSHTMGKNRKNDRKIPFSQSTWTGNIWTQRWWIVLHSTGNTLQLAVQAKIISSVDFKFPAFHFFIHRESFFFPPKQSHGQVEQTKPKNQPISANQSPLPPHKELH